MRKIDEFHLSHPEWGYPRMTEYLRASGLICNRKRSCSLDEKDEYSICFTQAKHLIISQKS
ncbi:transposase [Saprospira grandis]|uniref:transposase n=1 Tax=Saprospira grandis TaxID=1008 RepID=UPI00155AF371